MKKNLLLYSIYLIVFIYGCSREESMLQFQDKSYSLKNGSVINKFIIVLNYDNSIENLTIPLKNENVKARADELLKKHGILASVDQVYSTAIQGFSVKLAPGQIDKLSLDKNVKMMQADKIIYLPERTKLNSAEISPSEITQEIPWGINRVGGPQNYTGTNVAWILDTGIDLDHPDLNVNTEKSVSFIPDESPDDSNGHGTHVAGIVAAKDNTSFVVGVAAGATVISVKVLSNNGTGTVSGLLSGLDYVAANGVLGDVANLSLICNAFPVVDSTVLAASAKVKFAMGAGNYGQDADYYSPARADGKNLYTVSAMDNFDGWASFSNYGKHIDYCAPGVSILSLFINGSMAWMSGTSMATPHVTGLLLIGKIKQDGFVTGNPDKRRYPIAHTDRQRNN